MKKNINELGVAHAGLSHNNACEHEVLVITTSEIESGVILILHSLHEGRH